MNRWKRHLLAALIFAVSAVAFTWPLAAHLTTLFPSPSTLSAGDPNIFIWWFDWASKAVTNRLPVPASQMLFYPNGINPWSGYDGPLMLALGIPLTLLSGNAILAYDLFILAAITGSAYSAYLLCLRLTKSWPAGIVAGFLFGISPYMLVRALQHPNLIMIGTLPLLVLAALECCDQPRKVRPYVFLGLAAAANAASSWYYAIIGLLFLGLIAIFRRDIWRKNLAQLFVAGAIISAATAALALPMLLSTTGGNKPENPAFVGRMGAKPVDFILPNALTNVFGGLHILLPKNPPTPEGMPTPNVFERSTFFGLPLLLLVAVYVKRRRTSLLPQPWLWITCFFLFVTLSLGTELTVFGVTVPLPFAALRSLFPFSLFRVPNRFFVGSLLCASLMAGDVFAQMHRQKWFATFFGRAAALFIGILFIAERIIYPYPLYAQHGSAFYKQLAADDGRYAVANLPNVYPDFSDYNLAQIVHGKPTTSGSYFYPAYEPKVFAEIHKNPLLKSAICFPRQEVAPFDLERDVWPDFRALNIRYLIVHNLVAHNVPQCDGMQQRIRSVLGGITPDFTDGELTVYRVPEAK